LNRLNAAPHERVLHGVVLGTAQIGYQPCYENGTARQAFSRILTSGHL
jgi:hypothetical protein